MSHRRRENTSLYIRGLSKGTSTEQLRKVFEKYGEVKDTYVPRDHHTKEPRGFAYVQFSDPNDAENARQKMDGTSIDGKVVEVLFAQGERKTPQQMRYKTDRRYGSRYGSRYGGVSGGYRSRRSYSPYDKYRRGRRYSRSYSRSRSPRRRSRSFERRRRSITPDRKKPMSYRKRVSRSRSYSRSSASPPRNNNHHSKSKSPTQKNIKYESPDSSWNPADDNASNSKNDQVMDNSNGGDVGKSESNNNYDSSSPR